jgi:hypothetical protein
MPAVQQWGRRESIISPPRRYLYTLGAIFLSLVATRFFVYVRFQFGLTPLERYYLPYYLRTELTGLTRPASSYQLLYVSDGKSRPRTALEADLKPGTTPQLTGRPLPLVLSSQARQQGFRLLFREQPRSYSNKSLQAWIEHWVHADIPLGPATIAMLHPGGGIGPIPALQALHLASTAFSITRILCSSFWLNVTILGG